MSQHGGSSECPNERSTFFVTNFRARPRSSSDAALLMSRRGWPGSEPYRSASTLRSANSRSPASSKLSSGCRFPSCGHVPLADDSFDLVISEYGAAICADPYSWIPEASRLLRPGGELVLLGNSELLMLCVPDEDEAPATAELRRPHFDMHHFEWPDDPTIESHLGHGDWIRLLRENSFEILDLIELRPPPGATSSYGFVEAWWADRWPREDVWRARRMERGLAFSSAPEACDGCVGHSGSARAGGHPRRRPRSIWWVQRPGSGCSTSTPKPW
jgi:SAM-dependent methyltransferase